MHMLSASLAFTFFPLRLFPLSIPLLSPIRFFRFPRFRFHSRLRFCFPIQFLFSRFYCFRFHLGFRFHSVSDSNFLLCLFPLSLAFFGFYCVRFHFRFCIPLSIPITFPIPIPSPIPIFRVVCFRFFAFDSDPAFGFQRNGPPRKSCLWRIRRGGWAWERGRRSPTRYGYTRVRQY